MPFSSFERASTFFAALACLTAVVTPALADTQAQGQISSMWFVGSAGGAPGNYDVRVILANNPVICNNQIWAYINVGDANYSAMVAGLLAAKASGNTVLLDVTTDGAGYCHLAYFYHVN